MSKPTFTAEQNGFGVYFSDMRNKKTPIHKIKPYFMTLLLSFWTTAT